MREAPAPKRVCELGRIGLDLDWSNVRRLVVGFQPEGHGAIASAWDDGDQAFVIVNASPKKTRNDRANR
jgi:hypothetical protein